MAFRKMCKLFDLNGDGVIDSHEFVTLLTELNKDWTEATAYQLLKAYDKDGDGKLSHQEFFNWLFDEGRWYRKESRSNPGCFYYVNADTHEKSWSWPPYTDGRGASARLEDMDVDGDGVITPTEFIGAMLALDKDGDGTIKRSEIPCAGAASDDLFQSMDTEAVAWFIGTGAESEPKLNSAYQQAGLHNARPFYLNKHGAKICYESLPADWGFKHLPTKGLPKWTVSLGKERHYFIHALDKASPYPPVGSPWKTVQYERRGPRCTGEFMLQKHMNNGPSAGDGALTVQEMAEAFAKLDQDGSGSVDMKELEKLSAWRKT